MNRSPLHEHHRARHAHFTTVGDWEIADHFGDPIQEHLAVRNGVGIADLSLRGKILVTGEDRVPWLHSLISNDLLSLHPGHGLYSTLMNHKGKILSYFRAFLLERCVFLEDVGEIGDATFQALRKFLLFGTKAKMENVQAHWSLLLLCGPSSPELVEKAFGLKNLRPLDIHSIDIEGHEVWVARTEETGELDFEVYLPTEVVLPIWERLWDVGKALDLKPVGRTALESLRIEAGLPKAGPDLHEGIVPPEANLEGKAFSLTKGCYPGQEVVARMDTYGSVKRRLVGLIIDVPNRSLPSPGAKLYSGQREVGWVSSTAFSPCLQKAIALGFPLRDFAKPDTLLEIDIGGQRYPSRVQSLPFPYHSTRGPSPPSGSA